MEHTHKGEIFTMKRNISIYIPKPDTTPRALLIIDYVNFNEGLKYLADNNKPTWTPKREGIKRLKLYLEHEYKIGYIWGVVVTSEKYPREIEALGKKYRNYTKNGFNVYVNYTEDQKITCKNCQSVETMTTHPWNAVDIAMHICLKTNTNSVIPFKTVIVISSDDALVNMLLNLSTVEGIKVYTCGISYQMSDYFKRSLIPVCLDHLFHKASELNLTDFKPSHLINLISPFIRMPLSSHKPDVPKLIDMFDLDPQIYTQGGNMLEFTTGEEGSIIMAGMKYKGKNVRITTTELNRGQEHILAEILEDRADKYEELEQKLKVTEEMLSSQMQKNEKLEFELQKLDKECGNEMDRLIFIKNEELEIKMNSLYTKNDRLEDEIVDLAMTSGETIEKLRHKIEMFENTGITMDVLKNKGKANKPSVPVEQAKELFKLSRNMRISEAAKEANIDTKAAFKIIKLKKPETTETCLRNSMITHREIYEYIELHGIKEAKAKFKISRSTVTRIIRKYRVII